MTTYQRRGTNGYPRIPNGMEPGITPLRRPQHLAPHPPPRLSSGAVRDWNRFGPGEDVAPLGDLAKHGFGYISSMKNKAASRANFREQAEQTNLEKQELQIMRDKANGGGPSSPTTGDGGLPAADPTDSGPILPPTPKLGLRRKPGKVPPLPAKESTTGGPF